MKITEINDTLHDAVKSNWVSTMLTASFICMLIFLAVSSIFGESHGDLFLCISPFFAKLKNKISDLKNALDNMDDDVDDEIDAFTNKLEKFSSDDFLEKKMKQMEKKHEDKIEKKLQESEQEQKESLERQEKEMAEEYEEMERQCEELEADIDRQVDREFQEQEIMEKYERGEKLTAYEQRILAILLADQELDAKIKQEIAEANAAIEAEEREKKEKAKEKRAKVLGVMSKVGKEVVGSALGIPANNSSTSSSEKRNDVRKVWQMKYVGSGRPEHKGLVVQVPSRQQTGGPIPNELLEAIKNLGFDSGTASALFNGMSSSDWKIL